MAETEHKFNDWGYANLSASVSASATTFVLDPGGVVSLLPGYASGTYTYLTLVDAHANREVVRITAIDGNELTVERGQDGSVSQAWPAGTLLCQRLVAANLEGVIQEGIFRSITYNPNGILTAAYDGEKVYQSGPAAGERRWWKQSTGTKWRLIAGAIYGSEYLDADGYVVTPIKINPASDVSVPAGEWLEYNITTNVFGAGAASYTMIDETIAAADDTDGIGLDWPGTGPVVFGFEDPGSAVTYSIDLTFRAYCHNPPGIQSLKVQLFTGATQIGADWVIGDTALGDDDTWLNAAGDMTAHEYGITYLTTLTAAEAADLRVHFTPVGFGIAVGISVVEAEII